MMEDIFGFQDILKIARYTWTKAPVGTKYQVFIIIYLCAADIFIYFLRSQSDNLVINILLFNSVFHKP